MHKRILLLLFALPAAAFAQRSDSVRAPAIRSGAVELGIAGSLTAVEGLARVSLMLRAGTFRSIGGLLSGAEVEAGYSYTNALGAVDLQGSISLTGAAGGGIVWPYVAIAGGIRQEWLGSFSQVRYPIGCDIGMRLLLSDGAAVRTGYRFRRVLNDPVSTYSEHQILLGISLLVENTPNATSGE